MFASLFFGLAGAKIEPFFELANFSLNIFCMGFETFFVSLLVSLVGVGDDFVHEAYGLAILQVAENASDDAANSGAGEESETIFLRHSGLCAYFPNEPGNPNEEEGNTDSEPAA